MKKLTLWRAYTYATFAFVAMSLTLSLIMMSETFAYLVFLVVVFAIAHAISVAFDYFSRD